LTTFTFRSMVRSRLDQFLLGETSVVGS